MKISKIWKPLKVSLVFAVAMFVICGLIYPLALTGIGQLFFFDKANGSLIEKNGVIVGSELIGQEFTSDKFMKSRPSAVNYNTYTQEEKDNGTYGGVSTGSKNYGPSNPDLAQRVADDMDEFLLANPTVKKDEIPADLLTASGSGLDPHISPAGALIQIPALVQNTGLSEDVLIKIVKDNTMGKLLGVFGDEGVNVLQVNLDIADAMSK